MTQTPCGAKQQQHPQNCEPTRYLETILLSKLDDGLPSFSGGVCRIKHLQKQRRTSLEAFHTTFEVHETFFANGTLNLQQLGLLPL